MDDVEERREDFEAGEGSREWFGEGEVSKGERERLRAVASIEDTALTPGVTGRERFGSDLARRRPRRPAVGLVGGGKII